MLVEVDLTILKIRYCKNLVLFIYNQKHGGDFMKLNEFEKVSLLNQLLTLRHLRNLDNTDVDDGIYEDKIERYIEALKIGYVDYYSKLFGEENFSNDISSETDDFVHKVLHMYDFAGVSYNALNEDDKTEELKELVTFKGFDGLDEFDYDTICKFILSDHARYRGIVKPVSYNNSMYNIIKYESQLKEFSQLGDQALLSADQLRKLFERN